MDESARPQGELPLGHEPDARPVVELREVNERLLISALREQELATTLETERARLDVILSSIGDAVLVVDGEGRSVLTNAAYRRMMGDPDAAPVLEDAAGQALPAEEAPWRQAARGEVFTLEFSTLAADGTRRWWEAHGHPIGRNPGAQGGVVIIRDVSEHKRLERALLDQALHDPLTGLANRTLLYDRLDQALRSAQRTHSPLAVLLLDLDRFKVINDTLGHQAGDQVLREIAARLLLMLRAADTVARLGGDEFGMLLPGTGHDGALEAAERVRACLSAPVMITEQAVPVTFSIGIALGSARHTDIQELMQQADIAMYVAKRTQSGHAIYSPALATSAVRPAP